MVIILSLIYRVKDLIKYDKKTFSDYFAVLNSTFIIQIVGVIRGFFVAKFLGPSDYGILTGLKMITMLNKHGSLGFRAIATREASYYRGGGQHLLEKDIKDNAYSNELVLALILTLIGLFISIFYKDPKIYFGIILASFGLFFSKIFKIAETEIVIEKNFRRLAKVTLWVGLINSIIIISTVPWIGIYSSLSVPILGAIIGIILFFRGIDYNYQFRIKKKEIYRQIKIGIPISLNIIAYGTYRYAERIIVLSFFSTEKLGYYGIATVIMVNVLTLLLIGPKIRKIGILEKLGEKRYKEAHNQVLREFKIHLFLAFMAILFVWIVVDVFIPLVLNEYIEAIPICKILSIAIIFRVIGPYFHIVLTSPLLYKQGYIALLQFISTVLFIFGTFILKYLNYLSLMNIVILDVAGYAVFHLSYVFLYQRYFMRVYLR